MYPTLLILHILLAVICVQGGHHGGHHGHRHGGQHIGHQHKAHSNESNDDLFSLMHETGIQLRQYGTDWFYASHLFNSSTLVKSGDSSELVPASTHLSFMYIRGHMTGTAWGRYGDDFLFSWNAGGSLLIHLIYPDGIRHEELILGNTQKNHEADYTVVVPAGVYFATELNSGNFVLLTDLQSPAMDMSAYVHESEAEMVTKFPQYEIMLRRLSNIRQDDKPLNIPGSSAHDHNAHQGHDHHDAHQMQHHHDQHP